MIELTRKIAFKQTARLLIVASVLCVFFGNGVHMHALFDHMFEHGDVHAIMHSHSDNQDKKFKHAEAFDDKDTHQHPTATVDLTGTLTQKTSSEASTNTELSSAHSVSSSQRTLETPVLLYLDLSPPDHLYHSNCFSSYSLRGPPLG